MAGQAMAGMMRAVEAFQEAILMVDASVEPWKVLYVNSAFIDRVGVRGPCWLSNACVLLWTPVQP